MDFLEPCLSQGSLVSPGIEKTASSNSINQDLDTSGEFYDHGGFSQGGIQQELMELQGQLNDPQHNKYLSYEQALIEGNIYPTHSQGSQRRISQMSHIISEIVTTERNYVTDLNEIVEGYYVPMSTKVGLPVYGITEEDLNTLFGNIETIKTFNGNLLQQFEEAKSANNIGRCFLTEVEQFKSHYSTYCNNYANSVKVLVRISKDPGTSRLLKDLQKALGHMLPLGAFLLKPVQRVLKYPLLLKDLEKHLKSSEDHELVRNALVEMTKVAEHINAMKKKYEESDIKIQEIQSLIRGAEMLDLTQYGELVMEDTFRSLSGRFRGSGVRQLYMFERLLLVIKKEDEGYQYKTHMEMKDIQLNENVDNKNAFEVRSISTGQCYTFQAFTTEVRKKWVGAIKKFLIDSLPHIPDKAKQLILGGFPMEERRYKGYTTANAHDGKSKTYGGRTRSATANTPLRKIANVPKDSQSVPDRTLSPTKLLVAGLVSGSQTFFPSPIQTKGQSTSATDKPAASCEGRSNNAPPAEVHNEHFTSDQPNANFSNEQLSPRLHRKNCVRKTNTHHGGSCSTPHTQVKNGSSNLSLANESQQQHEVLASSPPPEKPLTPGGSLDTEQLFGDMILAPSTSPSLPPFPVPPISPLHGTDESPLQSNDELSPLHHTEQTNFPLLLHNTEQLLPVSSPMQNNNRQDPPCPDNPASFPSPVLPTATSELILDDPVLILPSDVTENIEDDPALGIDDPMIIPAPPEFSECSQLSSVSEYYSNTSQLTASGSIQVVQDVINEMEKHIQSSKQTPDHNVETLANEPWMQNTATMGVSSYKTLPYSPKENQINAISDVTPVNPRTEEYLQSTITYNPNSSAIHITIAPETAKLNEMVTDANTTPKGSRSQTRVHQLAREFSKKIRNTTHDVSPASSDDCDQNPEWLKRLKHKKETSLTETDDSNPSPKQLSKQPNKLQRQKSLTLTRNSDIMATKDTMQSNKGNASVPEKRKTVVLDSKTINTSVQVSGKSATQPASPNMKYTTSKQSPNTQALSQLDRSSPTSKPRTSYTLQIRSPQVMSLSSQVCHSTGSETPVKVMTEEIKAGSVVDTANESPHQKRNSKSKSSTFHRLSVVDPPTQNKGMQRAVSEANLDRTNIEESTVVDGESPQHRLRFKGWVKSLVDKFSSK